MLVNIFIIYFFQVTWAYFGDVTYFRNHCAVWNKLLRNLIWWRLSSVAYLLEIIYRLRYLWHSLANDILNPNNLYYICLLNGAILRCIFFRIVESKEFNLKYILNLIKVYLSQNLFDQSMMWAIFPVDILSLALIFARQILFEVSQQTWLIHDPW